MGDVPGITPEYPDLMLVSGANARIAISQKEEVAWMRDLMRTFHADQLVPG